MEKGSKTRGRQFYRIELSQLMYEEKRKEGDLLWYTRPFPQSVCRFGTGTLQRSTAADMHKNNRNSIK